MTDFDPASETGVLLGRYLAACRGAAPDTGAVCAFADRRGPGMDSECALFDPAHYLDQIRFADTGAINPVVHYLEIGHATGLSPHPLLDPVLDPGPTPPGVPPLLAVLETPGLSPHPLFDAATFGGPVTEFLADPGDRAFSPVFDRGWYLHKNPHLGGTNLLLHYLAQPSERRIDPNPFFQGNWYRGKTGCTGDAFVHFLTQGLAAGEMPNPFAEDDLGPRAGDPGAVLAYLERRA